MKCSQCGAGLLAWPMGGRLRRYGVWSPEVEMYARGEANQAEFGREWREVYAINGQRAKIVAVRSWRRIQRWRAAGDSRRTKFGLRAPEWPQADLHPFNGMSVECLPWIVVTDDGAFDSATPRTKLGEDAP